MKRHKYTTTVFNDARRLFMLFVASLMCCLTTDCASAQQGNGTTTADDHTIMLLQPGTNGTMIDAKNVFTPEVKGATTVSDASLGQVLQFGDEANNGIRVKDDGKIDFSCGMTLDIWIHLEQPDEKTPNPGGSVFAKAGSFSTMIRDNSFDVKGYSFSIGSLSFPTVPVVTTTDTQYKTYPVGGTSFPGSEPLSGNRWVRITLTYDPAMKVARSWIDGKLFWTEYFSREEALPLQNNVNSALSFVAGMKNVRVGEIHVSNVARAIETLTPFETYVHALPYRKQSAVIIDHILSSDLPVNVVLQSGNKQLQKLSLTDAKRKVVFFDAPVSDGQYPLSIKATSNGKEVYSRVVNVYAGDDTRDPVRIDEKNRLVINGKPVFPLYVYHTFPEDVPLLAKLGFTLFSARYPNDVAFSLPTRDDKSIAIAKQFLDLAKVNDILMVANGGIFAHGGTNTQMNTKGNEALDDHPALGIWYGADEPGRNRIRQLQPGYAEAKQKITRPVLSVTNRFDHLETLGETADILGNDPYPIPNISFRYVADFTKASVKAVAGLKPVWTVIPQYQYTPSDNKRPTEQELRSMAYIAIASGAQGLGIYAWDDRNAITKKGWRTGDHPEDVRILETVIGELNKLQDVLIIPNSTRVLTLAPDNPAIHVAIKESGQDSYLFVANDSRGAQEATLSIADLQSVDGVDVHDASQKLSIRGGKVHLQLSPLGARIYQLSNIQEGG
ncbi:MAG: hypothetical protein IT422_02330 [Pirellulaceae bacterium]|nr:hypothetical protein [Pirellulaceae bacterium]